MKAIRINHSGLVALVAALLLAFSPSALFAGGGTPPGPINGGGCKSGEDVESVPRQRVGFVLQVDAAQLQRVLRGIRSQGSVDVQAGAEGQFVVILRGRNVVTLDKRMVTSGQVSFTYLGQQEDARVIQRERAIFLIQN